MRKTKLFADNGVKVYIDEAVKDWDSTARYPYYRMRGARITEEQAFEIIRRADDFFAKHSLKGYYKDSIPSVKFRMEWFEEFYQNGWIHPNGIVGINSMMSKYPDLEDLIDEWTNYAEHFPYLDLVAAITQWDEFGTEREVWHGELWWEYNDSRINIDEFHKTTYDELRAIDLERNNFEENIDIGVWVHDGVVEIMSNERTIQKYLEYEKLYEEPNSLIYMPNYYRKLQPDLITKEYLFKCVKAYGIDDPEEFIKEHYSEYDYLYLLKDE